MSHIVELGMRNWLCYRGQHSLALKPVAYSIGATYDADHDRSNMAGKSAIPEAVDFALRGKHRHGTEDAWITRGEKEGSVRLVLDDGLVIERERKLGKSTRLTVTVPGGKPATQGDAQDLIAQRLGILPKDYVHTFYFEQGEMARFVKAMPGERVEIVGEWFRLELLRAAEAEVGAALAVLFKRRDVLAAKIGGLRDADGAPPDVAKLAADLVRVQTAYDARKRQADAAALDSAAGERAKQYGDLVREGTRIKAEVAAIDKAAVQAEHKAAQEAEVVGLGELRRADLDSAAKRRLVVDGFDGRCPVVAMACPAADVINGEKAKLAAASQRAAAAVLAASAARNAQATRRNAAEAAAQALERKEQMLAQLRDQIVRLGFTKEEAARAKEAGVLHEGAAHVAVIAQAAHQAAQEAHQALVAAQVALRSAQADAERQATTAVARAGLEADLAALEGEIATHRELHVIVGKGGAQRRVAEGKLLRVEDGANDGLRECGAQLTAALRWSREGGDPAKACGTCGSPFPPSAKVKECGRCGSPRGNNVIQELRVEMSDVSGAAKDMVGIAIQLSASAWLRRSRGAAWSVALIDEPFSACDKAHRRGLAAHFARLLRGRYGFEQAFIISHTPDTAVFPGAIEVSVAADGARAVRVSS